MPFTALCPGCRVTKVRAGWRRVGTPMACPRCEQSFLLYPDDTPPALTERPNYAADRLPEVVRVAEVEEDARPAARVGEPIREAAVMALVALALVGLAGLASLFPYGRIAGVAVAAGGAALAGLSLPGLADWRRVGWAGVGANGVALLFLLALPGWVGLNGWVPAREVTAGPPVVTAVGRDDGLPRPATDRVDAATAVWQHGDVRVAVTSVQVCLPDTVPGAPPARGYVLRVGVKLSNVGVERAIAFAGWARPAPDAPRLTAAGQPLPLVAVVGDPAPAVYPGKAVEAVLTFGLPAKPTPLDLDLPAAAFGGAEPVRYRIPQALAFGR